MLKPSLTLKVQKRDDFICQYCGKDGLASLDNWSQTIVDNFKPAKGNKLKNLTTSCQLCNKIKGKEVFKSIQEARGFIMSNRVQLQKIFLKVRKKMKR